MCQFTNPVCECATAAHHRPTTHASVDSPTAAKNHVSEFSIDKHMLNVLSFRSSLLKTVASLTISDLLWRISVMAGEAYLILEVGDWSRGQVATSSLQIQWMSSVHMSCWARHWLAFEQIYHEQKTLTITLDLNEHR